MSRPSDSDRRKHVADYEVEREIGQGGMGVVYLAHQETLERSVVLKKIRRELLGDSIAVERFRREACAAAAIHHQNVVAVYDAFRWRNDLYIAQELVDGQDLRAILDKARCLHPEIAALIALEVVRGLEEIHARGIVHRDVKPGNILIGWEGETKIADFGIALADNGSGLTRPGLMIGSLPYMSPEQILGEPLDRRSDLFLLGILLYEMITGVTPFQVSTGESNDTLLQRMQNAHYTPLRRLAPQAPRWTARLVRTCLRGRPAQRIASTTAVRRLLERRLGSHSPADCRRRIAIYLRERRVLEPLQGHAVVRPASPRRPMARRRRTPRRQQRNQPPYPVLSAVIWGRAAIAAGLLVVMFVTGYVLWPTPDAGTGTGTEAGAAAGTASAKPSRTAPGAKAAGPASAELAQVRFVEPLAPRPVEPAQVRFAAYPWAEISIEDGPSFLTPRAQPVELAPGSHRIVFAHPRYGEVTVTVDVEPGEERVVRHTFEEASR
jgi:serine/threonine-protein kinase